MTRKPKTLWVIIVAGVIIRLFLVFSIPLYPEQTFLPGYNDEPMHLNYVRHLAEEKSWPIWDAEASKLTTLVDEFPQPPLYYLIATPAYQLGEWISAGGGLFGARLVSLFFGIVTSLIIYWICKQMLGDRRGARAGLAFATFSPNLVVFSSLVTNDSLLFCLSALAFGSIVFAYKGIGGAVRQVKTGLFLAIAVWAKMSALAMLPLVWFATGRVPREGEAWQARLRTGLTAVALILPLFVWNIAHYGQVVPTVSIYTPEESGNIGTGFEHPVKAVAYLARTAAQPFDQVWGSIPEKGTTILWLSMCAGVFLFGLWHLRDMEVRWLVLSGFALPVIALIYYNFRFFQIEARLLAPAVASVAIIIAAGMRRLSIPVGWQCVIWGSPLIVTISWRLWG